MTWHYKEYQKLSAKNHRSYQFLIAQFLLSELEEGAETEHFRGPEE